MSRISLIASIAVLAVAAPLGAQQLGPSKVPEGHKPPPGMCRIWIDGVPPGRQSAPTDCPTAVRNRPSNGRVIWGDDDRKRDSDRPTRPVDERDNPRGSDDRERPRPSEPREIRGSDRPRETKEAPKPRESGESPKPRETRETRKEEPEERRPSAKPRKPDDDSRDRAPETERSTERQKPDFTRKPR